MMGRAEFGALLQKATPDERISLLRERFRVRLDEFARHLWPERFDLPFNRLHYALFEHQLVPGWEERRSQKNTIRRVVAAPRGYAKSTIKSFVACVHDVCYDREAYTLLISATTWLAVSLCRDLYEQFSVDNADSELWRLYGPFKVTGGVEGFLVSARGRPPVGFLPRSYGTEVRGARHPTRGIRPTKFIIDDGEKKDRVHNPDQRALWWNWLTKDVLKGGSRAGGAVYDWVGTVLHSDSILSRLLRDAGWEHQVWRAIERWPDNKELWEKCRKIWTDLTLGQYRQDAARAFYEAHRDEMDAGAILLDPGSRSLFDLYLLIWSEGLAAFLQEMQNDPLDPNARIFQSENFARFSVTPDGRTIVAPEGRRVQIDSLRKFGRWDPSAGGPHADYSALAILGRDRLGYTYVLDVDMKKSKPHEQLASAWRLSERWGCKVISVEANGFQSLVTEPYQRERTARKAKNQYWDLALDLDTNKENKELRIASMQPDTENGWILFNEAIESNVFEQFDMFPTADHDDGPDAIQGAWEKLGGRPATMGG